MFIDVIIFLNLKLHHESLRNCIYVTFPTARPPTTEQITPHTFTTSVCGKQKQKENTVTLYTSVCVCTRVCVCVCVPSVSPPWES